MKEIKLYVVNNKINTTNPKVISEYCKTNGSIIKFIDEQPLDKLLYEVTYVNGIPISVR